jgi:hypothetical protein
MTRKHIVSPDQAEELVHRLYQQASTEEPSTDLDDAILAQAKAGLDPEKPSSQHASRKSPLQVWQRFGSLAASVVVVVTIGMIYHDHREQLAPETPVQLMAEPELDSQRAPVASSVVADDSGDHPEKQKAAAIRVPAPKSEEQVADQVIEPDARFDIAPAEAMIQSNESSSRVLQESSATPAASSAAPVMKRMMSAPPMDGLEARLNKVRALLAAGENDQARAQWQVLQADYSDSELPEDLVQFFAGDHQVGEAQ